MASNAEPALPKHPALVLAAFVALATPAHAQVHIGNNVFVGDHRLKPHSAAWVKIRTITGYTGPLGCRIFPHGATIDGRFYAGPVRRCVWKVVPRGERRR